MSGEPMKLIKARIPKSLNERLQRLVDRGHADVDNVAWSVIEHEVAELEAFHEIEPHPEREHGDE